MQNDADFCDPPAPQLRRRIRRLNQKKGILDNMCILGFPWWLVVSGSALIFLHILGKYGKINNGELVEKAGTVGSAALLLFTFWRW